MSQLDYCIRHGSQEFFLGDVFRNGEYLGEAIHCPHCFPNHPDNPANAHERAIAQMEAIGMMEVL